MAEIQPVNINIEDMISVNNNPKRQDLGGIEWLFKEMDTEEIVELAMKAKNDDSINDNILSLSDIKILENHGLKIDML